jgi:hypothetical protein
VLTAVSLCATAQRIQLHSTRTRNARELSRIDQGTAADDVLQIVQVTLALLNSFVINPNYCQVMRTDSADQNTRASKNEKGGGKYSGATIVKDRRPCRTDFFAQITWGGLKCCSFGATLEVLKPV